MKTKKTLSIAELRSQWFKLQDLDRAQALEMNRMQAGAQAARSLSSFTRGNLLCGAFSKCSTPPSKTDFSLDKVRSQAMKRYAAVGPQVFGV